MTLIEIMVVIAILGILAVAIGVSVIGWIVEGRRKTTKLQVHNVSQAVSVYAAHEGYPDSLDEVADRQLIKRDQLKDPWQQRLLYDLPSDREGFVFDVCSRAEDGVVRSEDDICQD